MVQRDTRHGWGHGDIMGEVTGALGTRLLDLVYDDGAGCARSFQAEGTKFSGWVTRAEGRLPGGGGGGGRKHSGQDDVLWGRGKCGLAHVRLGPRVSKRDTCRCSWREAAPAAPS